MTLHEFTALDEMEQLEAFWEGTLIGERQDGEYRVICKQIAAFYVEYLMLSDEPRDMRCFTNPDLLQPYLDQMSVDI